MVAILKNDALSAFKLDVRLLLLIKVGPGPVELLNRANALHQFLLVLFEIEHGFAHDRDGLDGIRVRGRPFPGLIDQLLIVKVLKVLGDPIESIVDIRQVVNEEANGPADREGADFIR